MPQVFDELEPVAVSFDDLTPVPVPKRQLDIPPGSQRIEPQIVPEGIEPDRLYPAGLRERISGMVAGTPDRPSKRMLVQAPLMSVLFPEAAAAIERGPIAKSEEPMVDIPRGAAEAFVKYAPSPMSAAWLLPKDAREKVQAGLTDVVDPTWDFMTSPMGVGTIALGGAPAMTGRAGPAVKAIADAAQRIVGAGFAAQGTVSLPESVQAAIEAKDLRERTAALGQTGMNLMMLAGGPVALRGIREPIEPGDFPNLRAYGARRGRPYKVQADVWTGPAERTLIDLPAPIMPPPELWQGAGVTAETMRSARPVVIDVPGVPGQRLLPAKAGQGAKQWVVNTAGEIADWNVMTDQQKAAHKWRVISAPAEPSPVARPLAAVPVGAEPKAVAPVPPAAPAGVAEPTPVAAATVAPVEQPAAPAAQLEIEVPAPTGPRPKQLFVRIIGDETDMYPVESLQDASKKYSIVRERSGMGASGLPGAEIVDQDGNFVGRISYNGRVWDRAGNQLYPPVKKGAEYAISQRSATEVPVEVPPGRGAEVGAQVREPEKPAQAREAEAPQGEVALTKPAEVEATAHPVSRIGAVANKYGFTLEMPRTDTGERNNNALSFGNSTYPTLVSSDGNVKIALDATDIFERRGNVYVADATDVDPNRVTFSAITVEPKVRGKGLASKALEDIHRIADALGITVVGEPNRMATFAKPKALTTQQLVAWYKRHGWEQRTKGSNLILERKPKGGVPNAQEAQRLQEVAPPAAVPEKPAASTAPAQPAPAKLSPTDVGISKQEKAFRSTAEGQKAMASRASRVATLHLMNEAIRKVDPKEAYDRALIDMTPDSGIDSMMESLRQDYNRLVGKAPEQQPAPAKENALLNRLRSEYESAAAEHERVFRQVESEHKQGTYTGAGLSPFDNPDVKRALTERNKAERALRKAEKQFAEKPALAATAPAEPSRPATTKGAGPSKTPETKAPTIVTAQISEPYSKDAIKRAFNLTDEQVEATDAIVSAIGIDTGKLSVAKGGTPASDALNQLTPEYQDVLRNLINEGHQDAKHFQKALDIQLALDKNKLFWKLNKEKPWLEDNAEYWKSVDPDVLCQKSEGCDSAVNYMKQVLGDKYSSDLAWELIARSNSKDLQTPCPQCYVYSARAKPGQSMQKKYVIGVGGFDGSVLRTLDGNLDLLRMRALRQYFSTDFKAEHIPGLIAQTMAMSERKLPIGAYTKDADFVRIFGPTGAHINLSIGRNDQVGMNRAQAMKLRSQHEKVGTVYVAFTDAEVLAALRDPQVDHVIPWHGSGQARSELASRLKDQTIVDYTRSQSEVDPATGLKAKVQIKDYEHGGSLTKYLALVRKNGVTMKFPQFYDALKKSGQDHLYMKLIGPEYGKFGGEYPYAPVTSDINYGAVPAAMKNRLKSRLGSNREYIDVARGIISEVRRDKFVHAPVEPVVLTGPLAQRTSAQLAQGTKGATEFASEGKAIIRGFSNSDVSTGIHEVAHVARRQLFDRSLKSEQRAGITDADIATAESWAGAKDGVWTRTAEEKFARGFERYLRDGKAPTSALKNIFSKFKEWLSNIYQRIAGSDINVKISSEMRRVFDRLVTRTENKPQVESAPAAAPEPSPQPAPEPKRLRTMKEIREDLDAGLGNQGGFINPTILAEIKAWAEKIYQKGMAVRDFVGKLIEAFGEGFQNIYRGIYNEISKAPTPETSLKNNIKKAIPDSDPTSVAMERRTKKYGFSALDPASGATPAERAVILYAERTYGEAKANEAAILAEIQDQIRSAFSTSATGDLNVKATNPGDSLKTSDVLGRYRTEPWRYQFTPKQRQVWEDVIKPIIERIEEMKGAAGLPAELENWFPRYPVTEPITIADVVQEWRGRPGSKRTFEFERSFPSEQAGWDSKKVTYETDLASIIARAVRDTRVAIAGKELRSNPNIKLETEAQLAARVKAENPTYNKKQVEDAVRDLKGAGRIESPIFEGVYSDAETASKLNDLMAMSHGRTRQYLVKVNNTVKQGAWGYDLAVGQLHGLNLFFYPPWMKHWAKAQGAAVKGMLNPDWFNGYIRDNIEVVREMAAQGHSIGRAYDIERGSALEKSKIIGPITRMANRHMNTFLDVAMIELYKANRTHMTPETAFEGIRTIENVLSSTRMEAAGWSPKQAQSARVAFLAPMYNLSPLDMVAQLRAKGISGQLARKAVGGQIAGRLAWYIGVGLAIGMPLGDLLRRLNPSNGDFLTWSVTDTDGRKVNISIAGQQRMWMRFAGRLSMAVANTLKDPSRLDDWDKGSILGETFGQFRSLASPVVDWTMVIGSRGKDFSGQDTDLSDMVGRTIPAVLQNYIMQRRGEPPLGTIGKMAKFAGFQAFPESYQAQYIRERDQNARSRFKKDYEDLTWDQQRAVSRDTPYHKPTASPAEVARAREKELEREGEMRKMLSPEVLQVLDGAGVNPGAWDKRLTVSGTKLLLTDDQSKLYANLIAEKINEMIPRTRLGANWPEDEKQDELRKTLAYARERARGELGAKLQAQRRK